MTIDFLFKITTPFLLSANFSISYIKIEFNVLSKNEKKNRRTKKYIRDQNRRFFYLLKHSVYEKKKSVDNTFLEVVFAVARHMVQELTCGRIVCDT